MDDGGRQHVLGSGNWSTLHRGIFAHGVLDVFQKETARGSRSVGNRWAGSGEKLLKGDLMTDSVGGFFSHQG